jgi:hypothetical protein
VDSRKGSVYGFEHLLIPFSLINFNKGILYNFGVAVSCFSFLVFCGGVSPFCVKPARELWGEEGRRTALDFRFWNDAM